MRSTNLTPKSSDVVVALRAGLSGEDLTSWFDHRNQELPHPRVLFSHAEQPVESLGVSANFGSDLDMADCRAAEVVLSAFQEAVGEEAASEVERAYNEGWQASPYTEATVPLIHAAFDGKPPSFDDTEKSIRGQDGDEYPEDTDPDPEAVGAVKKKIEQDRQLFRETFGETIRLFRGIQTGGDDYTPRPLETWTPNPAIAAEYADGDGTLLDATFSVDSFAGIGVFSHLPDPEFIVSENEAESAYEQHTVEGLGGATGPGIRKLALNGVAELVF